jgi:hypothetical protein
VRLRGSTHRPPSRSGAKQSDLDRPVHWRDGGRNAAGANKSTTPDSDGRGSIKGEEAERRRPKTQLAGDANTLPDTSISHPGRSIAGSP